MKEILKYIANKKGTNEYRILDATHINKIHADMLKLDNPIAFIVQREYAQLYVTQDFPLQTITIGANTYTYVKHENNIFIEEMCQHKDDDYKVAIATIVYGKEVTSEAKKKYVVDLVGEKLTEKLERDKTDIQEQINMLRNDMKNYMKKVMEYNKTIEGYMARLAHQTVIDEVLKKTREEIEKIYSHKLTDDIDVANNCIEIRTNNIYIREHKTQSRYYLGKMLISFDLQTGGVRFTNMNNGRSGTYWSDVAPHPHVDSNGEPCLGTADAQLCQFLSNRDWYAAFITAINYLQQVDTDDIAGSYVCIWDEVDESGKVIIPGHPPEENEYGINCNGCGSELDEEDAYYCENCERPLCGECVLIIDGRCYCRDCANEFYKICDECNKWIPDGDEIMYDNMTLCDDCYEQKTKEEEQEDDWI